MSYWQDKVAVVTGGSTGLGKAVAGALAESHARVVIAARGTASLEAARGALSGTGRSVVSIAADVTRDEDVERLFAETISRFGRLDLLVNNAGRSMRRSILETTPEDFSELLNLNLLGVVRCTRAAVPHLLETRGHLVNVGSLAGKSASRYVGAYPASKFALSAYTQQVRLELGEKGLHVLLVCPGPIAREEPREHAPDDLAGLPPSAARPGAGVKTRAISPDWLARAILRSCERRRSELVVPWTARLLFAVMDLWPFAGDYLLNRFT
jgi:NAD(P)-dependent dehydrogenase (short-subunit alcohol dehydrogenase family)